LATLASLQEVIRKALDLSKAALAQRMHASGEPVSMIASALWVSRPTVYRVLAERAS
jgi:DNA invertase Pin-like site-specific DNA recombinase